MLPLTSSYDRDVGVAYVVFGTTGLGAAFVARVASGEAAGPVSVSALAGVVVALTLAALVSGTWLLAASSHPDRSPTEATDREVRRAIDE